MRDGSILLAAGTGFGPELSYPVLERIRALRPASLVELVTPMGDGTAPTLPEMVAALRRRVEQAPAPVTLVAESFDAVVALALGIDRPTGLGAIAIHEPIDGPDEAVRATVAHATRRLLDAGDPVGGAQDLVERLIGSDTWSRLPPSSRGITRHHSTDLRRFMTSLVRWNPREWQPGSLTFVSTGRGSAPMRHRLAATTAAHDGRRLVAGRGHLLSLDDPAALVDLALVASDAAVARETARMAGHPSARGHTVDELARSA